MTPASPEVMSRKPTSIENTDALINDYKSRLKDLENNIWMH